LAKSIFRSRSANKGSVFGQTYSAPKLTTFRYLALNSENKPVKGSIKARNEAEAEQKLAENSLRPVNIEALASKFNREKMLPSLFGTKSSEVSSFSKQLATLLESGIDIISALELIQEQTSSRGLKKVLVALADDLRSGLAFSQALAKHPAVFNDIFSRTIALAEQTGRLEVLLRQLAEYQEKQDEAMKKVKGALTYPALIMCVGVVVSIILITMVLPTMIDMFQRMETELPLPTRILIALSNFVNGNLMYLAITVGLAVALLVYGIKRPSIKLRLDRILLRTPALGPPIHSAQMARLSRTASILLGAGLQIQEIIDMIASTMGNLAIRQSLKKVSQELVRGGGISQPMKMDCLFPPLLTQMVMVGEESNTLEYSLGVAAAFYETDSSEKVGALVHVISPAATIIMALLVGFMALSVIMPMYSMTGQF
jgi:type IV pilus assembly protein PilC